MDFKEALLQTWHEQNGDAVDEFLFKALDFIEGDTRAVGSRSEKGWIATHLGIPMEELKWIKGPGDVEKGLYTPIEREGLKVLIHESREVAYIEVWPKGMAPDTLSNLLKRNFGIHPLLELHHRSHGWSRVAESRQRKGGHGRVVDFEIDLALKTAVTMESPTPILAWNKERLEAQDWLYLRRGDQIHVKGERPPGLVDIFGQEFQPSSSSKTFVDGRGISRSSDGIWEVSIPGFLGLVEGRLETFSPVVVAPEGKEAYFFCHRDMENLPRAHFDRFLAQAGVSEGLLEEGFSACQALIAERHLGLSKVLIARGLEPIQGEDATLNWKVPPLDTPGEVQEDGSIDYRAGKRVFLAKEGEIIAEKRKATPGQDGVSVLGQRVPCKRGVDVRFEAGENVEKEDVGDLILFKAARQGVPKLHRNRIELSPSLFLPEGVNFNTGNIDFDGDVIVDGSIQHGFSVKARGKVTVYDSVENGAEVCCLGHLRVGKGIIGAKTKVVVKGNIETRFIQEATVMGGGDLKVTDHLYHARVRCEGRVLVDRCSVSDRSGSIVGGYVWGVQGLEAHYLGSPSEAATVVGVGLDEMRRSSREEIQRQADDLHRQVMIIVQRLQLPNLKKETLDGFITNQPKAAPVIERLREVLVDYQKRLGQIKEFEALDSKEGGNVMVEVGNKIYPNVTLYHGRHQKLFSKTNFCKSWIIKGGELISK